MEPFVQGYFDLFPKLHNLFKFGVFEFKRNNYHYKHLWAQYIVNSQLGKSSQLGASDNPFRLLISLSRCGAYHRHDPQSGLFS
jgi:hypothetical protein